LVLAILEDIKCVHSRHTKDKLVFSTLYLEFLEEFKCVNLLAREGKLLNGLWYSFF
jgi:hypothetical protein